MALFGVESDELLWENYASGEGLYARASDQG